MFGRISRRWLFPLALPRRTSRRVTRRRVTRRLVKKRLVKQRVIKRRVVKQRCASRSSTVRRRVCRPATPTISAIPAPLATPAVVRVPVTALHLLNHHTGRFHCEIPGCKCEEALSSTTIERYPVIRRSPVTKEHLVAVITNRFKCEIPGCPCHAARLHYDNALHDSTYKLVYSLVGRSCYGSPDERKELSQICFERILENLDSFDRAKGSFLTWAGTVTKNILRHEYKKRGRRERVFSPLEPSHEAIARPSSELCLRSDIISAAEKIRDLYPKWNDVFDVIFGKQDHFMPDDFSVTEVAKATRRRYNEVHVFLARIVRPFFKTWLHGGIK
jgi:RNA polymerase sigma factor (sigma-70 family)